MTTFVDPRVRMRDALCAIVGEDREAWAQPSLTVFRNRLLDITGSDARPLADLLLEAAQRGWHEAVPRQRVDAAQWYALSAPFVLRWSAERFVQPEMAQWAAESWGLAFGALAIEHIRVAPPAPPKPIEVPAAQRAGLVLATGAASPPRSGARGAGMPGRYANVPTVPVRGTRSRGLRTKPFVPLSRSPSQLPMLDARIVWGLAAAAALSYVFFLVRITMAVDQGRRAEVAAARAAARRAQFAGKMQPPKLAPLDTAKRGAVSPSGVTASPRPPAGNRSNGIAAPSIVAQKPDSAPGAPSGATTSVPAPGRGPGVPGLTRNLLDARVADPNRMLYVDPARRASGSSLPLPLPPAPAPLTYDEIFLNSGSTMRGRVEVVRAGTVLFRDMRTGLRHELRKEEIDHIITEFGSAVRFRAADLAPGAKSFAAERKRVETGVRAKGVAGTYTLRYAPPTAQGSPECTQVWTKPPNAIDRATVVHVPGADTLTVGFDGGDTFPSNIDPEGYFASTFRIVPDQARTSTALTTRLTGQFTADGSLALQVNIVFYRRLREGQDLTCAVAVKANGSRLPR